MFILERLINVIAPNDCLVCGTEGSILCDWCKPDAMLAIPSRCYQCQKQTQDFLVCRKCQSRSKLKHVWVVTEYNDVAKNLVQSLKFSYMREAALVIAEYMAETLPYLLPETMIVPVRTANVRVRQRGFDHAALIAKALVQRKNAQYAPVLKRIGTSRQVGAKREQRLRQLKDAFWVSNPSMIYKKHIILVDDVVTTGATLETIARELKKAGAASVSAVVFAQAK